MKAVRYPLCLLIFLSSFASIAQIVQEGAVFVDAYYGFPDWRKNFFENEYSGQEYNVNINSTNHIGARIEYLISRHIGFGLDMWYVKTSVDGTKEVINYYNNPPSSSPTVVNFTRTMGRFCYMGRFIAHFGSSEKVDPYIHVGIGYANYDNKFTSSNKAAYYDAYTNELPIAFRTGFGMRFMFSKHVGVNFDLGLGGPLFSTGLTAKF